MIYVLLTYLIYPLLFLIISLKRKKENKRILVIQTAKIGDLICSTPVFGEIKKKYPYSYLTAMVSPVTKELLENNPYINEIITIKNADFKGFLGKIKLSNLIYKERYDVAICLNPNVPFTIALFWGLVPVRLSVMPDFSGITFKLASIFFTHVEKHISGRLVIETYMQMLKVIGIESDNISKEVYKSDNADLKAQQILGGIDKPLIGIAVSSGNKLKELGTTKIAELANMLLDNMDIYLALIGSDQEKNTTNMVFDLVNKKDKVINATGRLSLAELPALIERLSLFIGVDSGITYMADTLSIPLINIAGPADMQDQRPTGKNAAIVQKKLACVPCSHAFKSPYNCKLNTRECITAVSVEEICSAAKRIISGN